MKSQDFRTRNYVKKYNSSVCSDKLHCLYIRELGTASITLYVGSFLDRLRFLLFGKIWICMETEDYPDIHLSCFKSPWTENKKDI